VTQAQKVAGRGETVGQVAHQGGGEQGDYPHGSVEPLDFFPQPSGSEQLPETGQIAAPYRELEKI